MPNESEVRASNEYILGAMTEGISGFSKIAEILPGAGFQWIERSDGTGEFRYVSSKIEEYFGIPVADVWKFTSYIHQDDQPGWQEKINQAKESLTEWSYDGRFQYADGSVKWFRVFAKPVKVTDDQVLFSGILQDVTEFREAQTALNWSFSLMEAQFNTVPEGILVVGPEREILFLNRRIYEIFKFSFKIEMQDEESAFLNHIYQLAKKPQMLEKRVEAVYQQQEAVEDFEITLQDGTSVEAYTSPLQGSSGEHYGRIWCFHDLTLKVKSEDELSRAVELAKESNRAKSRFLATMSHEIRTPMNGIIGFSDVLLGTELDESQREYLDHIRSSGHHLLNLINGILDYSKIEAGKIRLEQHSFKLKDHLKEVITMIKTGADDKGVDLRMTLSQNLPESVEGDSNRLKQVLINLLSNAVKFTNEGSVVLHVEESGRTKTNLHRIRFSVQDSGIGISKEKVDLLFQPFQQADDSTARKYGGTGLGLVISKHLVSIMGGNIELKSELGVGTEFYFTLELEDATKKETSQFMQTQSLDFYKGNDKVSEKLPLNILVAEDNPLNQKLMSMILKKMGYEIDIVANGLLALRYLEAHPECDVVLMDINMPEMDGIAACKEIRRRESENSDRKRVGIIALTADAMEEDRKRCLDAGMDAFLTKPIKGPALQQTLQQMFMSGV